MSAAAVEEEKTFQINKKNEKKRKEKGKKKGAGWCKWLIFIHGGVREFSKV